MISIFAVGDVFCDIDDDASAFRHVSPLLSTADIVFGNCEGVYSDRPAYAPSRKHFMGTGLAHAASLGAVPFHVMACANNHMLDGGYDGLEDTLGTLRDQGILTTGAGSNLSEALSPAVITRSGLRVAFLAVCSTFPKGYEARRDRPGIAPLRISTLYADPDPAFWEPGMPARVVTMADDGDLAKLAQAITQARERADVVVLACHWGISSDRERLQPYELTLARQAIDFGADVVVCHHHHSLRGMELHDGKPIFYGLGAFVHHFRPHSFTKEDDAKRRQRMGDEDYFAAQAFPLFPLRPAARMTGIAVFELESPDRIRAGLIAAEIQPDGSTEPLPERDHRATVVFDHIEALTSASGLQAKCRREAYNGWAFLSVADA